MAFNTPFKIFDTQVQLAVRGQNSENDFPEIRTIIDPTDTSKRSTRVYQRTYLQTVDVDFSVAVPQLIKSQWNITPNVSLSNVDPGAYLVRSERTGTAWVSQSKRLSYGLSISPTFFGISRWGFGPVARFRQSITPGDMIGQLSPGSTPDSTEITSLFRKPFFAAVSHADDHREQRAISAR